MSHNFPSHTADRPSGIIVHPWARDTYTSNSDVTRFVRFQATRTLTIKKIGFLVTTGGAAADPIQLGIFDSAGAQLAATTTNTTLYTTNTGSTTTNITSTGMKWGALSSNYTVTTGTIYYAALAHDYSSGSPAFRCYSQGFDTDGCNPLGSSVGTAEMMALFGAGGATLPANMSSATTSNAAPYMVLSAA